MADLIIPGTAVPGNVLSGVTFSAGTNYQAPGSMPNQGAVIITPGPNAQAIPAGYHNGGGSVPGVSVPAANVLVGTTIAGTPGAMPDQGAPTFTPGASNQGMAAGHYSGGTILGVPVDASKVLVGTTIAGTPGAMPNQGAPTYTPGTGNQGIPAGYYSGGTVIGDPNLAAGNILSGVPIFGVVGNLAQRLVASGSVTSSIGQSTFYNSVGSQVNYYAVTVSGLAFTPTFIIVYAGALDSTVWCSSPATFWTEYSTTGRSMELGGAASVSVGGFTMPVGRQSGTYNYICFQ